MIVQCKHMQKAGLTAVNKARLLDFSCRVQAFVVQELRRDRQFETTNDIGRGTPILYRT
jgi:hypothetical protein